MPCDSCHVQNKLASFQPRLMFGGKAGAKVLTFFQQVSDLSFMKALLFFISNTLVLALGKPLQTSPLLESKARAYGSESAFCSFTLG